MKIVKANIKDIIPYKENAKEHPREQIEQIKQSILDYGNNDPIAVDENNVIIEGHGRFIALQELGHKTVEIIRLEHLSEEQKKAYRLVHNKLTMNSDFDREMLEREIAELTAFDVDMSFYGFDENAFNEIMEDVERDIQRYNSVPVSYEPTQPPHTEESEEEEHSEETAAEAYEENKETLQERFIVPPFSVLDTKQGYWQKRKAIWRKIIKSGEGRDDGLFGKGLENLVKIQSNTATLTGTSIFDPVLCEILINWFCPKGGKVLDPFAGGSVRGLISVLLGNEYTGIDLSERQIKANIENYEAIAGTKDLNGNDLKKPNWINGDSQNIDALAKGKYDFLLTCPPYADLEVYSDDPRDLSNMSYKDFKNAYTDIIYKASNKLKDNAYAAIVVGEVRDKHGYYYNFVGDTIAAFQRAGLKYYNECILLNQISTAALRADRQFSAWRKVVKTHQNVLIFVKGNEKQIALDKYDYDIEQGA